MCQVLTTGFKLDRDKEFDQIPVDFHQTFSIALSCLRQLLERCNFFHSLPTSINISHIKPHLNFD